MKTVLIIAAAVLLFWDIPASAKEELLFQVKNVSPQFVLFLKGKSSAQNISQDIGSMYSKVYGYMGTNTINPVGPPIALYFSAPGPDWEIGVAVPVPEGKLGQGAIEATTLPGGKMVSTMHIGQYEKLHESWNALSGWIKKVNILLQDLGGRYIYSDHLRSLIRLSFEPSCFGR